MTTIALSSFFSSRQTGGKRPLPGRFAAYAGRRGNGRFVSAFPHERLARGNLEDEP